MKPRWLTFDELVFELQLPPKRVRKLIREGRLVGICAGRKANYETDWRYLDPSEKYKRALEEQEKILSHAHSVDLMEFPVISSAEFAQIAGISSSRIRGLVFNRKLLPTKIGKYSLFTATQVREFLLRRERKEPTARRERCELLLRWCLERIKEAEGTMTAAQVENDDLLESTLQRLLRLKEPERTRAVQEFWRRYQLARDVAAVLNAGGNGSIPASTPSTAER